MVFGLLKPLRGDGDTVWLDSTEQDVADFHDRPIRPKGPQDTRLLLDTHALAWLLTDDPRLGVKARALLSRPDTDRAVPTLAIWEVTLKRARGRMPITAADIAVAMTPSGLEWLPPLPAHVAALWRNAPSRG